MTHTRKLTSIALGLAAAGFLAGPAFAQFSEQVDTTVEVLNTIQLSVDSDLNFGVIVAIGDTGQTASATVGTDSALSVATTGGSALTAIIDDSAAAAAEIGVSDAAPGATLNIEIDDVNNPIDLTDTFTLAGFVTSWNGGGDANRTASTPWTETFVGPADTLVIGATITTADPSGVYGDGTYTGDFDVTFSY